jgi:hypothetical protein
MASTTTRGSLFLFPIEKIGCCNKLLRGKRKFLFFGWLVGEKTHFLRVRRAKRPKFKVVCVNQPFVYTTVHTQGNHFKKEMVVLIFF